MTFELLFGANVPAVSLCCQGSAERQTGLPPCGRSHVTWAQPRPHPGDPAHPGVPLPVGRHSLFLGGRPPATLSPSASRFQTPSGEGHGAQARSVGLSDRLRAGRLSRWGHAGVRRDHPGPLPPHQEVGTLRSPHMEAARPEGGVIRTPTSRTPRS